MGFGGPHAVFFATRGSTNVRFRPFGRSTVMLKGRPALCLARNAGQHICRDKATTTSVRLSPAGLMASFYAVHADLKGSRRLRVGGSFASAS